MQDQVIRGTYKIVQLTATTHLLYLGKNIYLWRNSRKTGLIEHVSVSPKRSKPVTDRGRFYLLGRLPRPYATKYLRLYSHKSLFSHYYFLPTGLPLPEGNAKYILKISAVSARIHAMMDAINRTFTPVRPKVTKGGFA